MKTIDADVQRRRRQALLALLFFRPGASATARELRAALETVHGLATTVDKVRADLRWLAEVELVAVNEDVALLLEAGADIVAGRAAMP